MQNRFLPRRHSLIFIPNGLAHFLFCGYSAAFSPTNKMYFICRKQKWIGEFFRFCIDFLLAKLQFCLLRLGQKILTVIFLTDFKRNNQENVSMFCVHLYPIAILLIFEKKGVCLKLHLVVRAVGLTTLTQTRTKTKCPESAKTVYPVSK